MKKLLVILAICCFWNAKGQSLRETLQRADYFMEQGLYSQAVSDYKRVIFFDDSALLLYHSYQQLALCYRHLGKYELAAENFSQAFVHANTHIERQECILNNAWMLTLAKRFNAAYAELLSVSEELVDSQRFKKNYLTGLYYFEESNYDSASSCLKRCVPEHSLASRQIDSFIQLALKVEKFTPKKAKLLSTILPGLGQAVAGDYKNAANSFLLTGGLLTAFYIVSVTYHPVNAFLSIAPWFQRYYQGGIKKSGRIAEERILRKKGELFQQINRTIAAQKV